MDAIQCISSRMSIRKYLDKPVAKETVMEVIRLAQRSPSYKNTQPWEVAVLTGAQKEALSALLVGLLEAGKEPSPDLPIPQSWPEAEGGRISSLFAKRKEATGIDLSDPEVIKQAKKMNFQFYGAPCAIYIYQDKKLPEWSLFDLGLFAQTLMLAAAALGLGSVPQAFATDYAQDVKEFLGIPMSKRLVLGISLGYPDMESPANGLRTDRDPVEDVVQWFE